jgi:hypothetical protein
MEVDTIIVLFLVGISILFVFIASAPGQSLIALIKRMLGRKN